MKYDVSIIYCYYNTPIELKESIDSILKTKNKLKIQIVIVDNNSNKKVPLRIKKMPHITVINNKNNDGYGTGLNIGVKKAKSEVLILANPDIVFLKNSLKFLVSKAKEKKIGAVGPQMLSQNGEVLPTVSGKTTIGSFLFASSIIGKFFPDNYYYKKFFMIGKKRNKEMSVDVLSGACIAIRREIFELIGGFDERFFMYYEENDFCQSLKDKKLAVVYLPKAQIIHKIGASSDNKEQIEESFVESRFKYLKKYNNLIISFIVEFFLRVTTISGFIFFLALVTSAFLNFYKINSLLLFIGDFGRDYMAARDMLLTGQIPLVGIPSSVVWLHQGPLSVYFIGISFLIGNFNPIAPAIFYAFVGFITVATLYKLVKADSGRVVASFVALFYATSPIVVIGTRMPYHTASIPFFATLFFLCILNILKGNKRLLPAASFIAGILLLLELSNAVLVAVVGLLMIIKRPKLLKREIGKVILWFSFGISPFVIYDLTHNFVQTLGFPLWAINRVRLFVGLAESDKVTTGQLPEAIARIFQQLSGIIYPESILISILIGVVTFVYIIKRHVNDRRISLFTITLLWLFVPIAAFLIHASPGTAYFPFLYPSIAILVGFVSHALFKKSRAFLILFLLLVLTNAIFLVNNNYYLSIPGRMSALPPFSYSFGTAFSFQRDAAIAIVADAKGRDLKVEGGGLLKELVTGVDNYEYLVWYYGGSLQPDALLVYKVYEDKKEIKPSEKIIFSNSLIFVTRK